MRRKTLVFLGLAAVLCVGRPAFASGITMTVCMSSAPNAFGSPSWGAYVGNAMTGLQNGCAATGDPSLPSYYASGTSITPGDLMVTSYNSWQGVAPPANTVDAAEYGNRLHAGLVINGNGNLFSLSQLNFDMSSSDGNYLTWAGNFDATDNYSASRIGIAFDGSVITSGSATQLVKAFYYVGVGNAFWPDSPGGACDISCTTNWILSNGGNPGPFTVTTRYWLTDATGATVAEGTGVATVAPEPGSMVLLGTGLLGVAGLIRRRARR